MDDPIKKLGFDEIKSARPGLEELAGAARNPVVLLLENIRSLYNVGSMFRTADGALVEKIFLCGYTGYPPRKEIDKTALGAQETVHWRHFSDPVEAVAVLKGEGRHVFGLEIAENSRAYTSLQPEDFPLVLLVGNEVDGIGDALLAHCDGVLEIPQYGIKHSLNVSVAAGVALFECVRAFRNDG